MDHVFLKYWNQIIFVTSVAVYEKNQDKTKKKKHYTNPIKYITKLSNITELSMAIWIMKTWINKKL